ncbi:MAG: DUF4252 domain-containing protein [Thiohalospira sp.]
MKRIAVIFTIFLLLCQYSCITDQNKYKETDIFEEFETQQGFVVLHLPPVLFKLILNLSEDKTQFNSDLTDKIDVIKVLFFEENKNSVTKNDVNNKINQKVKDFSYKLLTKITQENSNISIYIIEHEKIIKEVLFTTLSENEFFAVNVVGNFTKEEILKIYESINMQQVKSMSNQ